MVTPSGQHLYVMQNEFGLIKIGRSVDVERRRLSLQSTDRCAISVVEIYAGCGDIEESIHLDMADYRLAGEWFDGSDDARADLRKLIDCDDPPIKWPYSYNPIGAAQWLDHIRVVRNADSIRRDVYRQISILRAADGPSWAHDIGIFYAKWRAETGNRPSVGRSNLNGEIVSRWFDPDGDDKGIVPAFTANIENAFLAWPDDVRPNTWRGSPIDCCIAALTTIQKRLPRVGRLASEC